MKKTAWIIITAILVTLLLGCTPQTGGDTEQRASESGGKTEVTMMYMIDLPEFEKLVEETYPDIDLKIERSTWATLDGESERRLKNGHGTDIITTMMPNGGVQDYAMDLSAESYVENYRSTIMHSMMTNGKTCFLPLPGQYLGYIYNETLAEKCGITEFSEEQDLLEFLDRAKEQGLGSEGMTVGLNEASKSAIASYIIGTQVPDFLGLADGITWSSQMQKREGTFAAGMGNCLDFFLELVNRGYLDPEDLSDTHNAVPVEERMLDGSMLFAYGNVLLLNRLNESGGDYQYTMIPFLSGEGNRSWTVAAPDAYLGLNRSLQEEGQEEKLDACSRVLALLSTPEGQTAFVSNSGAAETYLSQQIYNEELIPDEIETCIKDGYVYNIRIPAKVLRYFGDRMCAVLRGEEEINDALDEVDRYYLEGDDGIDYDQSIIGTVGKDMLFLDYNVRLEETEIGDLVADAVLDASGADMAFVNGGGIRASLYEGTVYGADLDAVCPYPNEIIVLEVPADTIERMLENSLTKMTGNNGIPGGRFLQVSGLCYTFEKPEGDTPARLLSVTLPDGSPLDKEKTYRIAVTDYMAGKSGYVDNNGDGYTMLNVYDENSPMEENVKLVKETGLFYADALQKYFEKHAGELITCELDGRIKAVEND